jgi:fluoride exporter
VPAPDPDESHDPLPGFPVDPDVTTGEDVPSPPRIRIDVLGAVAGGGALGAMAREAVAEAIPRHGSDFPRATLLTNVTGCFLIGILMVLIVERRPDRHLVRPFFGTGILGGFTTFATYALESRVLLAAGHLVTAAAYLAGTLVVGLVAVVAGISLTKRLMNR